MRQYIIILRGQAKYVFYKIKIMALLENSIVMTQHSVPVEWRKTNGSTNINRTIL